MGVKQMLKEFKEFALKGNIVDMAIGVIIGGAFGKIVTSLVNDIIMPFFGYITAGMDFNKLKFVISKAELAADGSVVKPEAAILYGAFIQNLIDFLIIAISIFFCIKLLSKLKRKEDKKEEVAEEQKPQEPTELELLAQIRDLLNEKKQTQGE